MASPKGPVAASPTIAALATIAAIGVLAAAGTSGVRAVRGAANEAAGAKSTVPATFFASVTGVPPARVEQAPAPDRHREPQPSRSRTPSPPSVQDGNTPYDGRFTFVRIRFETAPRGGIRGFRSFGGREPPWAHDYPRAERNLMRILDEITGIEPYLYGGNILTTDDPELFKFPVAYVSEPGFWEPTEAEVAGLRAYLQKGGFVIFDDFSGRDWYNFELQITRVLPGSRIVQLDASHPIFHSFFDIESLDLVQSYRGNQPIYLGIFEENDPEKRLLMVINYNNDIGDYWEWSDSGFVPIDLSNEAYKLGVNYIVYAMTH